MVFDNKDETDDPRQVKKGTHRKKGPTRNINGWSSRAWVIEKCLLEAKANGSSGEADFSVLSRSRNSVVLSDDNKIRVMNYSAINYSKRFLVFF